MFESMVHEAWVLDENQLFCFKFHLGGDKLLYFLPHYCDSRDISPYCRVCLPCSKEVVSLELGIDL